VSTLDTISLIDPISLCRIVIPSRSINCKHSQCFDLSIFLELNLDIPQWKCGICSRSAHIEDLIVDGFFASIVRKCDEDAENVDIEADGTWKVRPDEVIDAEQELRNDERKRKREQDAPRREAPACIPSAVIDLTYDSSDDNVAILLE